MSDVTDKITQTVANKFPIEEDFVDYSGQRRRFCILLHFQEMAQCFSLEARELSQSEGYIFEVFSPTYSAAALGSALGKIRHKIRKGISTRYMYADVDAKRKLIHDEISGRISPTGIVVDGLLLTFRDLEEILTTHEGFQIFIKISDPNE